MTATIPFRVQRGLVLGDNRRILSTMAFNDSRDDGGLSGTPNYTLIMPVGEDHASTEINGDPSLLPPINQVGKIVGMTFVNLGNHQTWKEKLSKAAGHIWQKNKVAITSAIAAGAGSAVGSTVASVFASSPVISGAISATVSATASVVASSVAEKAAAAAKARLGKKANSTDWKNSLQAEDMWQEYHEIIPYF